MDDLLSVVDKWFKDEGLSIKLFLPEDIWYLQGVESMIAPTLADPVVRQYADIIAVHGNDPDGVTAASTSAQTWETSMAEVLNTINLFGWRKHPDTKFFWCYHDARKGDVHRDQIWKCFSMVALGLEHYNTGCIFPYEP